MTHSRRAGDRGSPFHAGRRLNQAWLRLCSLRQHDQNTRYRQQKQSAQRGTNIVEDGWLRVSADRDHGRARQPYLRASKAELVQRLLAAEKDYAGMEHCWLRTDDDLLAWIVPIDRLITASAPHASGR